MKRTVSTLLALFLLFNLGGIEGQGALAQASGSGITIPDPVLEAKVREVLGKPEGVITEADAAKVDWLDACAPLDAPEDTLVKDVSALRYFVNLRGLKLDNNAVTDISALSGLTNLQELWLLGDAIDDLAPIGTLTGLVMLGIDASFRELPFLANLTNLEQLRIDACQVLPPELLQLHKLKVFCSLGGKLSDIGLLAQVPTLSVVDVSWNMVTDLTPLKNLPLTELYLAGNPVEDYTPIRDLMPKLVGHDFEYIELKQPENPNAVVAFADPVLEQKVRAALGKPQGDITAGDAAKVTHLEVGNEWSQDIPRENQVSNLQGIESFINLQELNAGFSAIRDLGPLAALPSLRKLNLGGNQVEDLAPLSGLRKLEELTLFGNRFHDITPLAGLTKLSSLHLGNNAVPDIGVLAGLTNLSSLYLGACTLEDIRPLAGLTNMMNLELSNNYITDLTPLAGLTNLVKLNLANNPIQDYTPIQDIFPKLKEKDFEYGQKFDIEAPLKPAQPDAAIPLTDPGLEAILRKATGVKDRALTQLDLSRIINLAGDTDSMWQSVSDISALAYCLNLEWLSIYNAKVSDLSTLSGLTRLAALTVYDSAVSDLSPLENLGKLKVLDLKGNQITDVTPLKALTQLVKLDVSDNRITDLSPLYGLSQLTILYVNRNATADASGFSGIAQHLKDKDFDPGKPLDTVSQPPAQPEDASKVIRFADKVLEKRVRTALGKPEGDITAEDAAAVEKLNLGNEWQDKFPKGSQINKLGGIEYFVNLKQLDISWNTIKDIKPLAGLTRLEYLKAFGNKISNITPLAGLTNLNNLNIGGNKVTKLDALGGLDKLTALYLKDNPIKDFSPIAAIYPQLTEKDFTLP